MKIFHSIRNSLKKYIRYHPHTALFLVLFLSLISRVFIAFNFEGTGDSGGWRLAGKTGWHKQQFGMGNGTVYDGDCPLLCANWPPLTYHYYIGMRWVYEHSNPFHLPQWGFYKLVPVFASVGIAYLVYIFARMYKLRNPIFYASLYAFHPLSLYVSAYHGQRESVWLFFLLLAVYLLYIKRYYLIGIAFATATSIKIPPLVFMPLLLLSIPSKKAKTLFIFIVPAIFFALNLPEIVTHSENVLKQVFLYQGISGSWGLLGIAEKINLFTDNILPTDAIRLTSKSAQYIGIVAITLYAYYKKADIIEGLLAILLIIFVFSPIFASQYMLWPLPMLLLHYRKYKTFFWLYSVISIFVAANSYGIFGFTFLEKYLLEIPNALVFYKVPLNAYVYPFQFYLPLWVLSICMLLYVIRQIASKRKL